MPELKDEIPSIDQVASNIALLQDSNNLTPPSKNLATLDARTRTWLAITLIVGLEVTLAAIGVVIFLTEDVNIKRELINLVWTSEITLVSGALGYYFGSKGN